VRFRDLALTPSAALPAPPTASIACQCDWDHANREEYAERQHHPQPIGVHAVSSSMPSTRRSARAELMREAREIRSRTRKVGKPTQTPTSQAQRSAMREIAKGSMPARGWPKE